MLSLKMRRGLAVLIAAAAVAAGILVAGCAGRAAGERQSSPAEAPATAAAEAVADEKSGAELWAENCGRCHNFRSPSEFNRYQWEIIVHQMRVRAPLTAHEAKAILEFLAAQ